MARIVVVVSSTGTAWLVGSQDLGWGVRDGHVIGGVDDISGAVSAWARGWDTEAYWLKLGWGSFTLIEVSDE